MLENLQLEKDRVRERYAKFLKFGVSVFIVPQK